MAVQQLPTPQHAPVTPAAKPAAGHVNSASLDEIFAMLRRRLGLIVVVVLAGTGVAALIGHAITRQYTATAAVVIDATDQSFMEFLDNRSPEGGAPDRIATEIELITSRSHLELVMNDLQLFGDPGFQPTQEPDIDLPEPLRTAASILPDSWLVQTGMAKEKLSPETDLSQPEVRTAAAVDRFRNRLEVERRNNAQVISIRFNSSEPDKAATVANRVADLYVSSQVEYKRDMGRRAASWLQQRLDELRNAVEEAEEEAARYRTEQGLAARAGGSTLNEQRILDLNDRLSVLRAEKVAMQTKLERARALQRSDEGQQAIADVLASPRLDDLRAEAMALVRQRAEMGQAFGPNHPRMRSIDAEFDTIHERIRLEIHHALRNLEDEVEAIDAHQRIVEQDLQELQQENAREAQATIRLSELERQAQANRELYEMFLRQSKAAHERIDMMVPDARVISRAVPPTMASTPSPSVFALIGFTASLMFGSFLTFLVERLDRRIQNAHTIERSLGLKVIGILPQVRDRSARQWPGRYVAERPLSAFAEATSSITNSLRSAVYGSDAPVFLITSALPHEGKTTLSISLAAAAVRSGLKTLLIDLDLRRPILAQHMAEAPDLQGLAEHLRGELPLSELVHHEGKSGIDFVTVGAGLDNPFEVLQSPRLRELVKTWRRDYDHIIIDSAPILAVTDTKFALRFADLVVLAARWKYTELDAVAQATRVLLEANVPISGCVLTVVNMKKYRLYASGEAGSYYRRFRGYYVD